MPKKIPFLLAVMFLMACNGDEPLDTPYPISFSYKNFEIGKLHIYVVKTTDYQYTEVSPSWKTDAESEADTEIKQTVSFLEKDDELIKNLSFVDAKKLEINNDAVFSSDFSYALNGSIFSVKNTTQPAFILNWDKTKKTGNLPYVFVTVTDAKKKQWLPFTIEYGNTDNLDTAVKYYMKQKNLQINDSLAIDVSNFIFNQQ